MEETSIHENYTEAYRLFDLIALDVSAGHAMISAECCNFQFILENIFISVCEIP